jgi:hypothetical protein
LSCNQVTQKKKKKKIFLYKTQTNNKQQKTNNKQQTTKNKLETTKTKKKKKIK